MIEAAEALLERFKIRARRLDARRALVVLYADALCGSLGGCEPAAAAAAALLVDAAVSGEEPVELEAPGSVLREAERAAREAEEAYMRSPSSVYAVVGLDASALSYMGAAAAAAAGGRGLAGLLASLSQALSYCYARDYLLYTRQARRIASETAPRTIAFARWLAEEARALGLELTVKVERTPAGLVALLEPRSCRGARVDKMPVFKPLAGSARYIVEYDAPSCGLRRTRVEIVVPESTRRV